MFRGHSTRESTSIIWNDERGDLFYSAGPHRNQCWQQLTREKLGRGFGNKHTQKAGDRMWRVKISSRKKSLAAGEASMAIF